MNATETKMTATEFKVVVAMRQNVENLSRGWGSVYLDNCRCDLTPHQFAGVLGSLAAKGLYRDECGEFKGVFGEVKLA